jgi:putative holliday junction resolvase
VSDELGITAQGLETVNCKNPDADVKRIAQLADEYQVEAIVVGIPFNMNGTEGPQVVKVRGVIDRISKTIDVPVREWDERLSTCAAERALLEADMSRAKRRKVVDKVAAIIILQGYLDSLHLKGCSMP